MDNHRHTSRDYLAKKEQDQYEEGDVSFAAILAHIRRLEARIAVLEDASSFFAPENSGAAPSHGRASSSFALAPSVASSARGVSPGAYPHGDSFLSMARGSRSVSLGNAAGSAAAATLASRYGKLTSIAQGRPSSGRFVPGGSSYSHASTSASASAAGADGEMPRTRPMNFKNGITLLKDRRLLGKTLHTRHLKAQFEAIVDNAHLRARPFLSRNASARQLDNAICNAFVALGHSLHLGDQCGFEYAYLAAGTLKLCTLGVTEPRDKLTGDEFYLEYAKRECYIVVLSDAKSPLYDPIFFADAEVISDGDGDDDDDDGRSLPDITGRDFRKCAFCLHSFSIDLFKPHEQDCMERWSRNHTRTESTVKKEPTSVNLFLDEDTASASTQVEAGAEGGSAFASARDGDRLLDRQERTPNFTATGTASEPEPETAIGEAGDAQDAQSSELTELSSNEAVDVTNNKSTRGRKRTRRYL
ncbi:hypothetical protein OC844_005822 [Tilletia horrida]|nr:hypothetical protein OC844_005822 [Tilletia horrida]